MKEYNPTQEEKQEWYITACNQVLDMVYQARDDKRESQAKDILDSCEKIEQVRRKLIDNKELSKLDRGYLNLCLVSWLSQITLNHTRLEVAAKQIKILIKENTEFANKNEEEEQSPILTLVKNKE